MDISYPTIIDRAQNFSQNNGVIFRLLYSGRCLAMRE